MARKRVNLQWIANDSTRRATLKKRSYALMKKVGEVSTLCGVKAAVVVYGEGEVIPEVYPTVPEAMHLLYSFKAVPDYLENFKKVLSLEEYLRGRVSRLQDQMFRSEREKREEEATYHLYAAMSGHGPRPANLTVEQVVNLSKLVERKMKSTEERFGQLLIGQGPSQQQPVMSPQELPPLPSQLQAPYTYTEIPNLQVGQVEEPLPHTYAEMPILEQVEEPQPQQQDWLSDYFPWNGGEELAPVVHSDMSISNDGADPSKNGGDTMQQYNMDASGSGFPSWSPGPFPEME